MALKIATIISGSINELIIPLKNTQNSPHCVSNIDKTPINSAEPIPSFA